MVVMFVIVVFVVNGTFRTIPTIESYGILRGFSTVTTEDRLRFSSTSPMMSVPDPTEEGSHHKISSTRPVISKKDPSFIFINQSCEFSPYCILSSLQGSTGGG
jgi:hypothetical protein